MTTLALSLSPTLTTTLSQPGVWAYAVYFDASGTPQWTELVIDGAPQGSSPFQIALPNPYKSGKIYILIQSQDTDTYDLKTLIDGENKINWPNASAWSFRYDSIEVNLENSINDQGNLTSVNGFGLPMDLSVTYADGSTETRGYAVSGSTIFDDVKAASGATTVFPFTDGPLAGTNPVTDRAGLSPSESVAIGSDAFAPSDWNATIDALKTSGETIAFAGFFNGAADANNVWHNAGFYAYALEWDAAKGVFWLSPTESSQIQGHIQITPADLANSIYSQLGDVGIYTNKTDAEPYAIYNHAAYANGNYSMNSGENNQWGEVLTQFFTGFTAGFYGATGKSPNTLVSERIDLDTNWNWDPTYAFGANLATGADNFSDPYSKIFFNNSNSYGSPYADNLMRQFDVGGPLIPLSNADGTNVSTINLTIYGDGDTPSGYVTPSINNYIAYDGAGYEVPSTTSANTITLNFKNSEMILREDAALSLDIFAGLDQSGKPTWTTIDLAPPGGGSPWLVWTISGTAGNFTATPAGGTPPDAGNLILANIPVGDAGVHWYRINVGTGDDLKTFNVYADLEETNGQLQFVNPAVGNPPKSLAVDGLATLAPQASSAATIETFTINFLYQSTIAVDPDLVTRNTAVSTHGQPAAPVAGTLASGTDFTAIAGQTNLATNAVSAGQPDVAFGWTGLNDGSPNTPSWVSNYTNKIGALNYAEITFTGGPSIAPLVTQADIDGAWQTAARNLGTGTYTVTMQEYLTDTGGNPADPVGGVSSPLTLTVAVTEVGLTRAGANALTLADAGESEVPGNWVQFDVVRSTLPTGTTLIIYAVNEAGERVSEDGTRAGPSVSLEEATRASVGSVHADGRAVLIHGEQAVYLETGNALRFALLSGDEVIDIDPDIDITPRRDGSVRIVVDDVILRAETDNSLTAGSNLAETQRETNEALLYVEHGDILDLEIAGSTAHTNTVAFVEIDINPTTGAWSVAGVPYGDTDAFREAVRAHLDGAFAFEGGGDFTGNATWTVAGDDGYYAPVLLTQTGNLFVVGEANPFGNEQIRIFGENTFGFEDLAEDENSDFDYNDMVLHIVPREMAGDFDLV
ncbi:hypothetical protein [Acuticoccus kandeliae]|uniref:hypothetical protein n=1 Tax=Acuticoccus kandeliae TaxID=2073160 RepID=UPI000D3E1EE3|nr:hypothetical protein [Acuticoccus kandeliae]